MTLHYWCITATLLAISAVQAAAPKLLIAPAPDGETASPDWSVEVEGKPVFLYTVGTLNGGPASFGSFDFEGKVSVTVRSTRPVRSAKILPASFGLTPTIDGNALTFQITSPRNLTI